MTESKLQRKFLKWLDDMGIFHVKIVAATKAGAPDDIACVNGNFVGIEFKRDGEVPDPLQIYNGNKIIKSNGVYMVVTPGGLDSAKKAILTIATY